MRVLINGVAYFCVKAESSGKYVILKLHDGSYVNVNMNSITDSNKCVKLLVKDGFYDFTNYKYFFLGEN